MLFEHKIRPRERCPHPESTTTTNFGLKRVVCVRCGHVEMHNLPREVVVQAESLKAAAITR